MFHKVPHRRTSGLFWPSPKKIQVCRPTKARRDADRVPHNIRTAKLLRLGALFGYPKSLAQSAS